MHRYPWRPKRRSTIAMTLLCSAAVALTGCSSSSSNSDTSPSSNSVTSGSAGTPGSSTTTSSAADAGQVAADVARLSKPVTSYTVPSDAIDVKPLRGRTIYYIPIIQQAPTFEAISEAMDKALDAAGLKLQICDGKANPSSISGCINQAVGARAAGIVLDSIPYGFAANALAAAQAKGVPVLVADQLLDPAHPASATLGYLPGHAQQMVETIAKWIIVESRGKAVVVINEVTDNPSSVTYVEKAQSVFHSACPGCTVKINKISSANFQLIAPSTSSAILKTPGVNYVISEYDNFLQPTGGGVQQAGKAASVKIVSTSATLSSIQAMAKGQGPTADVGQSSPFQGWANADAILRLALKEPVPTYDIPYRLFTADNIHSIKATSAAEASGEWFGPTTFPAQFKAIWKSS